MSNALINNWIDINVEPPPMDVPVLVHLESPFLQSTYQVAVYHKNITMIGNHFKFDVPNVTHWQHIQELDNT